MRYTALIQKKWKTAKKHFFTNLMAKYSPKDIFNADECGLFYNMLLDKTYIFKGASCKDIKVNIKKAHHSCVWKLRWHKWVLTSCHRTIKTTILFKNMKCLPSTYSSNKAAWMTCEIFHELQLSLDRRMASKKSKILLFVNHCPAHPTDGGNFKNMQVVSHSCKHDISFAIYASRYQQGLETEVS